MTMPSLFYMAAVIAVFSTLMMLTRLNAVHALLYLIVSLLAVAVVFYSLGAPFIAALEIIIYAGAIMVLFVFVVMLLNLGGRATELERSWVRPRMYVGPAILAALLLAEMVIMLSQTHVAAHSIAVGPKEVGTALYGPYLSDRCGTGLHAVTGSFSGRLPLGRRQTRGAFRRKPC